MSEPQPPSESLVQVPQVVPEVVQDPAPALVSPESTPPLLDTPPASEVALAPPLPAFKVYKPSNTPTSFTPPPPLSESYFTPTSGDLKVAQAQLASRSQALVDAPLQLKATREAAEQAKRDRWPTTTIRIKFPDRTQVEKVFHSTDKIKSVYAFVRELLREDVKPVKFVLAEPPRRELKVSDPKVRDLSLAKLQLAPSSLLVLRFEDDKLNASNIPAPLTPEVLSQAIDLVLPSQNGATNGAATTSQPFSVQLPSKADIEKKMPKWFKGLMKK